MHDQSLQVVFFSPTKNTQKILAEVAGGMNLPLTSQPYIDITAEFQRKNLKENIIGDIILFGVPVYSGKIPSMVLPLIATLEGNGRWITQLEEWHDHHGQPGNAEAECETESELTEVHRVRKMSDQ